jgi:hypothetical protein
MWGQDRRPLGHGVWLMIDQLDRAASANDDASCESSRNPKPMPKIGDLGQLVESLRLRIEHLELRLKTEFRSGKNSGSHNPA